MDAHIHFSSRTAAGLRLAAFSIICAGLALSCAAPQASAKTTPTIHWADPPIIRYGAGLNGNILNAWVSGHLPGTFVYSPPLGTVLSAGVHTLSVTFNPTDSADYNSVSTTVGLEVIQKVLMVTAINVKLQPYGDAIRTLPYTIANFTNGDTIGVVKGAPSVTTTAVRGSPVGQYPITITTGSLYASNYSFEFTGATLTIIPAPLSVHAYDVGPIPYSNTFPAFHYSIVGFRNGDTESIVTGAASVTTTASAGSPPGQYPITPKVGTIAAPNYYFEFRGGTLTIGKKTPTIIWNTPLPITYGAALSATQLDANANVAGTFVYSPPAGTVQQPGMDSLLVTFTPANSTDYATAVASVQLPVNKATPVINWPMPASIPAGTALSSTQLDATSPVAGAFVYAPHAGTVQSAPGVYALSAAFTPTDTTHYAAASASQKIAVTGAGFAPTTTSLAITSSGGIVTAVVSGGVVTLTATVKSGGLPLASGSVNFCDAAATHCEDIHIVGTAQLTSAGTATIKFRPGVGSHSYEAVFTGTKIAALSASAAEPLTVTANGLYPSTTTIAHSGDVGNYSLKATVSGLGPETPTGDISFLDATDGNALLGTAALSAGTPELSFLDTLDPLGLSAAYGPLAIAVGDFNGDGIPDVAVAIGTNFNPGEVGILLGKGDGTFSAMTTLQTNVWPEGIAVGDFNSDGVPDLGVTNYYSDSVTILLGNGDGTFKAEAVSPATGSGPASIIIGDFNGDGIQDIVVANEKSNTVTVLLGNGDGTFTAAASPSAGIYPLSIATGDFNGDGILDLALAIQGACCSSPGSVMVLLGNGDGTFKATSTGPQTGIGPDSITVGDFNGDGIPDLAVSNGTVGDTTGSVTVLLGNGDGAFTATASSPPTGRLPGSIVEGDFNGDGIVDLAVVNTDGHSVTMLLGNGDGTFTALQTAQPTGSESLGAAAADLNGDGTTDVVVAVCCQAGETSALGVLLSQSSQTATATLTGVAAPGTGKQQVVASYPGDSNYKPSESSSVPLTGGSSASPANSAQVNRPITPMSVPK